MIGMYVGNIPTTTLFGRNSKNYSIELHILTLTKMPRNSEKNVLLDTRAMIYIFFNQNIDNGVIELSS